MAKSKVGHVIFRKIKGRIVRIKIKNFDATEQGLSMYAPRKRHISAYANGDLVGRLKLSVPKSGKSATIDSVNVEKEFRKKGIAKNLFARATQFLSRANYKFLRSDELRHVAPVKIRASYGAYRAGGKLKSRTRYFGDQFGPYGEHTRRIPRKVVNEYIKNNREGRLITATTMLKRHKPVKIKSKTFKIFGTGFSVSSKSKRVIKSEAVQILRRHRKLTTRAQRSKIIKDLKEFK